MGTKRTPAEIRHMMSGFGIGMDVWQKLLRILNEKSPSAAQAVHHLTTEKGELTLDAVSDLILRDYRLGITTFPVEIDYDLTVEAMVRMGKLDKVDRMVTGENFFADPDGSGLACAQMVLFRLGYEAGWDEISSAILNEGLRPARIEHLCAFARERFAMALNERIAAIGSTHKDHSKEVHVLTLTRTNFGLELRPMFTQHRWAADWTFLAVASEQSVNADTPIRHPRLDNNHPRQRMIAEALDGEQYGREVGFSRPPAPDGEPDLDQFDRIGTLPPGSELRVDEVEARIGRLSACHTNMRPIVSVVRSGLDANASTLDENRPFTPDPDAEHDSDDK
ncbi:MAG: hypothetical protein ABIG66_03255 [Candidatus Kerfeldbacteria bacterium]